MINDETGKNDMELGIESIKIGNSKNSGYRHRKRKLGRTYINILHDPRVVRGNTYAAFVIPSSLQMEFVRLKEEEERRKRMLRVPKNLPRVALLCQKKAKEEEYLEEMENKTEPDSPHLKHLEEPDGVIDNAYFFEDRPPTPKFIPLPPGIEIATQIEDNELFDYDLEVEPILQVLVGRSLVSATYELIEEHERKEFLLHKKKYEQEREFELINLQRTEAARQRREDEKKRRLNGVNLKKLVDIELQKKLMCKMSAKVYLQNLTNNGVKQLYERGLLKDNKELGLFKFIENCYIPVCEDIVYKNNKVEQVLMQRIRTENTSKMCEEHKVSVNKDKERINTNKENKENAIKTAEENELKRIREKAERTETRRVNRITKSITDNILITKRIKSDITILSLCDIDELSFKNENVHCLGGQFGITVIALDQVLRQLASNQIISNENLNLHEVFRNFLEEFLLNGLKDNQVFEIRYLESKKYDFTQSPENEDKRKEFIGFLTDDRRIVNKSIKLLLEKEHVSDYVYKIFLESVANLYFEVSNDPATAIEVDSENQEPAYLQSIKKKQEDIVKHNSTLEKLKKKIKLNFIKGEVLKKKVNNFGGFITVKSNMQMTGSIMEIEEVPVIITPKEENEILDKEVLDKEILEKEKEKENNENNNSSDKALSDNNNNIPVVNTNPNNNNGIPTENNIPLVEEQVKPEPIVTKMDFLNEVEVFKNFTVPIDTYILHQEASEWFTSLIVRSIRRVLKTKYNVSIELLQTIHDVKEKINKMEISVIEHILANENYQGKSILPFNILPVQPVIEIEVENLNKTSNSGTAENKEKH